MASTAAAPGFAISRHDGLPPEAALVDDGLDQAQAAAHGCHQLFLETFSFQAPRFYAALGWRSVHQLDAYPHGIVKHLMRRDLDISELS
ncbi:MAG: hypothetical protein ACKVQR_20025 [Aquabacterium sp.]